MVFQDDGVLLKTKTMIRAQYNTRDTMKSVVRILCLVRTPELAQRPGCDV